MSAEEGSEGGAPGQDAKASSRGAAGVPGRLPRTPRGHASGARCPRGTGWRALAVKQEGGRRGCSRRAQPKGRVLNACA